MQRVIRKPRHEFALKVKPWQIQPCMIAPVLPGETMQNALMQARIQSDPIKSRFTGWWAEFYFFYVKHRDLDMRDDLVDMHLKDGALTAHLASSTSADFFTHNGGVKFVEGCLKRVTEEYFRNEEDGAWDAHKIGNLPLASVNRNTWFQSMVDDTYNPTLPAGGGVDPEDLTVYAEYVEMYEKMRDMALVDMTFPEWLAMHGVRNVEDAVPESMYKPELLRYIRQFTFPTVIGDSFGAPSSAVTWSMRERLDKNRFFKEPGFIFGVQVIRPKIYFGSQVGAAAAALDEARLWLPAAYRGEQYMSIREWPDPTSSAVGPLGTTPTNGYWADMRDLFIYGDQFRNFDVVTGNFGGVALPTAALQKRYATEAMADSLFNDSAAESVYTDGVVDLTILGTAGHDAT